jgi:hypothetical protein
LSSCSRQAMSDNTQDPKPPGDSAPIADTPQPSQWMCSYCAEMDVQQMVCHPGDTLDPSSSITSSSCYEVEGYRHQPSRQALLDSANAGCHICLAFTMEITRFMDENMLPQWPQRLQAISGVDDSQIYLHFPTSETHPSQGIHISVAAPFERLKSRRRPKAGRAIDTRKRVSARQPAVHWGRYQLLPG